MNQIFKPISNPLITVFDFEKPIAFYDIEDDAYLIDDGKEERALCVMCRVNTKGKAQKPFNVYLGDSG